MPSDALQDPNPTPAPSFSTGGAIARARRRRLAVLIALAVALAALSYAAFYYAQNRRLPIPEVVAGTQTTFTPPEFLFAFSGTDAQAMTKPTGIGVVADKVFVTDFALRTVRAYTRDGGYLFDFGPIKDGANTAMSSPVHIAVSKDNEIWVTDRGLRGVYIFDAAGKYLRKFIPNNDPKFAWSPLAITFGLDGNIYISDVGNTQKHRILVFAPDGRLIREWGHTQQIAAAGDSPGSFLFPNGIAVGGTGANALVFVADGNNRRVQVFKTDGTFVRIINTSGTPRGVALDAQGHLYVVDALSHRVDIYDQTGTSLTTFGENGVGPGQFNFPNDVTIDSDGRILITDRDNNQVQVWGYAKAEIPGITKVSAASWWLLLLLPLLLLPLLWRRRRFVVTPDFVDGMIVAEMVAKMAQGRRRWVMIEADAAGYAGRSAEGIALGDLLHGEPYSDTDAGLIKDRFSVTAARAGLLAMAKHYRVLCTDDVELARVAAALGIDVYDRASWIAKFAKQR